MINSDTDIALRFGGLEEKIMQNIQKRKSQAQRGFTMSELMIVVAIIALLAAIAVLRFRVHSAWLVLGGGLLGYLVSVGSLG